MPIKIKFLNIFIVFFICMAVTLPGSHALADGEEDLFTSSITPDALLLLDLSGSMAFNPAGGSDTTGNSSCTDMSSGSTDCSRLAIAKRAIFALLNDNRGGTSASVIDSSDFDSLGVRIGYMRFYNCQSSSDDTGDNYGNGCNKLIKPISELGKNTATSYQSTFCNAAKTGSCTITSSVSGSISGESALGGTHLAFALKEAKLYLDAHKVADPSKDCRKKFVILITDGADTYACSGNGYECQDHQYKRRRAVVDAAKALSPDYKVFVIGFGAAMPDELEKTLNWMAYYGGTDNPDQMNTGDVSGYNPASVTDCGVDTSGTYGTCTGYDPPTYSYKTRTSIYATNDPGTAALSGYAFLAADADQLAAALKTAMTFIRQANYAFSQSSVQSTRTTDENYLFEGSFEPSDTDPFWKGHLKKYQINTDGTVGNEIWDAGSVLRDTSSTSRTIYTAKGGVIKPFTAANVSPADLGFTTGTDTVKEAQQNATIGYFRGDTTYNPEQSVVDGTTVTWKLGDVFRSTPITVGTPSAFYDDVWDANDQFADHRCGHNRTSRTTTLPGDSTTCPPLLDNRLIVTGANAGQFHAFKASSGSEAWSFVPPNLLTKLKNIAHASHPPVSSSHLYFVDGPVTVADVWWGSGCGKAKESDSWKTLLVFGEGRGAIDYAWSTSASCDSGIGSSYSETDGYIHYCGYHALNITDTLSPSYLWHLDFASATARAAQAPYLGDPWSKMMVGRVRINVGGTDTEKWVGFIGGGYNKNECKTGNTCDARGKSFYVVDLSDGHILWSYTYSDNTDDMNYSLPGTAAIVDTDNDTFIDTVYIGDLGGNMWRFKFCRASDMPYCAISGQTTNWSGGLFYDSSTGAIRPIYTSPAVAKDRAGNLWVYWGTGDKNDPTAPNAQEYFYGVKDNDRTSTYSINDLQNINIKAYDSTKNGWYIPLNGPGGEKVLADPTIFGGVVYFTTYTPKEGGTNLCDQTGTATLYGVYYTTGAGALADGARSMVIGTGMPSSAVVSLKPGSDGGADIYVTTSGGTSSAHTQRIDINPQGASNRTNMLYWKDKRIETN